MSAKEVTDALRNMWVERISDFLREQGEEVCRTASGTVYLPVLDSNEDERWVKLSVIIPSDATEENGTDGYSLAAEYKATQESKAKKAAEAAEKKAKKIAKDAERRAKAKAKTASD